MSVTYGREIPPRLNPNVAEMIDQVKACCADLTRRIVGLQDEIVPLIDAGKLDHGERTALLESKDAVDAAPRTPEVASVSGRTTRFHMNEIDPAMRHPAGAPQ